MSSQFVHTKAAMDLAYLLVKEWNEWEHKQYRIFKQHNKEERTNRNTISDQALHDGLETTGEIQSTRTED